MNLKVFVFLAFVVILPSCGGNTEEEATGTTPGAEITQVIQAGEALNSITPPPLPTGFIHDARDAVDAANDRIRATDSLVRGL